MSHAMHMWNTAAATEHSTEPTSASERNLAADDAAATEHSELSADAVERHTTASPSLSPSLTATRRCSAFVPTTGTATEHPESALTTGTATEHSRTAAEHSGQHQVANGRWFWAKWRQVQWAHVTGELWKHGGLAIGLDGASGGFQGLVNDHDVVYVIGEGSMQWMDYFHGTKHMESRHGVAARAPWCQMMNEDDYPSYQLVSQKGRFAHALVLIQQAFRTKRFWRALNALRLLPEVSPDILHSIAHLCSGRALRNGIRYPVVGYDKVTGEPHRHFFEPKLLQST